MGVNTKLTQHENHHEYHYEFLKFFFSFKFDNILKNPTYNI